MSIVAATVLSVLNTPLNQFEGTLYYNDSGESHGGFEGACQWNVTLRVRGSIGVLLVTPAIGYMNSDRLKKWVFFIASFDVNSQKITMSIDGRFVELFFTNNDSVWNTYHNYYINAYPDLDPTIFPGFLDHYYVELRLAP